MKTGGSKGKADIPRLAMRAVEGVGTTDASAIAAAGDDGVEWGADGHDERRTTPRSDSSSASFAWRNRDDDVEEDDCGNGGSSSQAHDIFSLQQEQEQLLANSPFSITAAKVQMLQQQQQVPKTPRATLNRFLQVRLRPYRDVQRTRDIRREIMFALLSLTFVTVQTFNIYGMNFHKYNWVFLALVGVLIVARAVLRYGESTGGSGTHRLSLGKSEEITPSATQRRATTSSTSSISSTSSSSSQSSSTSMASWSSLSSSWSAPSSPRASPPSSASPSPDASSDSIITPPSGAETVASEHSSSTSSSPFRPLSPRNGSPAQITSATPGLASPSPVPPLSTAPSATATNIHAHTSTAHATTSSHTPDFHCTLSTTPAPQWAPIRLVAWCFGQRTAGAPETDTALMWTVGLQLLAGFLVFRLILDSRHPGSDVLVLAPSHILSAFAPSVMLSPFYASCRSVSQHAQVTFVALLFDAAETAFLVGYLPLQFVQDEYLYFPALHCFVLTAFAFISFFVLRVGGWLTVRGLELKMHSSISGAWQSAPSVHNDDHPVSLWELSHGPYPRGALVSHKGKRFVAQCASNFSEPGTSDSWLIRFISLNPSGVSRFLLLLAFAIWLTQMAFVSYSWHWKNYGFLALGSLLLVLLPTLERYQYCADRQIKLA
eukprot:TRINITY_DN10974_c0_g1_i1.p1 TRINITY_DN10974_c0_g1~~TRINITY_DN10974_c0_g1_i1.p1  ORF type:complete len:660 (-),score=122.96 TRINITY_DN10974_c0_g1_i1:189-2168(-)